MKRLYVLKNLLDCLQKNVLMEHVLLHSTQTARRGEGFWNCAQMHRGGRGVWPLSMHHISFPSQSHAHPSFFSVSFVQQWLVQQPNITLSTQNILDIHSTHETLLILSIVWVLLINININTNSLKTALSISISIPIVGKSPYQYQHQYQ